MIIERDPNYMRRIRASMWVTREHQKKARRERRELAEKRAAFKAESVLIKKTGARP